VTVGELDTADPCSPEGDPISPRADPATTNGTRSRQLQLGPPTANTKGVVDHHRGAYLNEPLGNT